MFLLDPGEKALVVLFAVTAMLSAGLQFSLADLRRQGIGATVLQRALLANFVAAPLVGVLLVRGFVHEPGPATALVLLACTPGGISALQFTTAGRGTAAFAGVVACLLSLLAVFLSPLLVALAMPGESPVVVPTARACAFLLAVLVVPLVLGALVKAGGWSGALRLSTWLKRVSILAFLSTMAVLMAPRREAIQQIGGRAVVLIIALILLWMLVGWLFGGPETDTRQVLAAATSMRNVALTLTLVAYTFPDTEAVLPPLLAFSALMVPPSLLLSLACEIARRRQGGCHCPRPVA